MRKFGRTYISDLGKGIEVFSQQHVDGGRAVVWHGWWWMEQELRTRSRLSRSSLGSFQNYFRRKIWCSIFLLNLQWTAVMGREADFCGGYSRCTETRWFHLNFLSSMLLFKKQATASLQSIISVGRTSRIINETFIKFAWREFFFFFSFFQCLGWIEVFLQHFQC